MPFTKKLGFVFKIGDFYGFFNFFIPWDSFSHFFDLHLGGQYLFQELGTNDRKRRISNAHVAERGKSMVVSGSP